MYKLIITKKLIFIISLSIFITSCSESQENCEECNNWEECLPITNGNGTWDVAFTMQCRSILDKYNRTYNGYHNITYEDGTLINSNINVLISDGGISNKRILTLNGNDLIIVFSDQESGNFIITKQSIFGTIVNQHNNTVNTNIVYEGSGSIVKNQANNTQQETILLTINCTVEFYNNLGAINFQGN